MGFLAIAVLSGMRWRLGVILIFISPVTGDGEPFKIVLVSVCVSSVYSSARFISPSVVLPFFPLDVSSLQSLINSG